MSATRPADSTNEALSATTTPGRPTSPSSRPPTAGPTSRGRLSASDPRALAACKCSSPTTRGTSAPRAGQKNWPIADCSSATT